MRCNIKRMKHYCSGYAPENIKPHMAEYEEFPPAQQRKIDNKLAGLPSKGSPGCRKCRNAQDRARYKRKRVWFDERDSQKRALIKGGESDKGVGNRVKVHAHGGGICHICLRPLTVSETHIEHVIPYKRGGTNTWDNILPAHGLCNQLKGVKLMEELEASGTLRRLREDRGPGTLQAGAPSEGSNTDGDHEGARVGEVGRNLRNLQPARQLARGYYRSLVSSISRWFTHDGKRDRGPRCL